MAISAIVTALGSLASSWLNGKQKVQEAKAEREAMALTNEANWDNIQAKSSKNSWKDEWLTLLVSIPMIMAFIPEMDAYVLAGFDVLDKMPEWYQYTIGLVFAASFGVKGAMKFIGKK